MIILPEHQANLELCRSEKLFVNYAKTKFDGFGYLLLRINPACIEKEELNALVTSDGIILFKFFDSFNRVDLLETVMVAYMSVYDSIVTTVANRLLGNKSIREDEKTLLFPINVVCIFPLISKSSIDIKSISTEFFAFLEKHCIFSEQFNSLRSNFTSIISELLLSSNVPVSKKRMVIDEQNINSIFQRITPEYTTVRIAKVVCDETEAGVDEELIVVSEDDKAIKAFMLDKDQINIVNSIKKGEQLILACAGSGKSVLLLSKCFKAASMNPNKKFLITCYNRNLQSQYAWLIDKAGFREKNVECVTFHTLCKNLLDRNGLNIPNNIEQFSSAVVNQMNQDKIKDRYYGIFIDEVQIFDQEWYKLCYQLLEHKSSEDHFFIICGDKTQDIKKRQKRGKAPWNVGEGYPNYRGGNKNIRIEKNHRNSIQINEYINGFVSLAKSYLLTVDSDMTIDPDLFLRGKAVREGLDVVVENIINRTNIGEANAIIKAIINIHKKHHIPYDEIAIVIYNKTYKGALRNWAYPYNIIDPLSEGLDLNRIPYAKMYAQKDGFSARYGIDNGVIITSFDGALGLDFRAVIVCGIKPLGAKDGTKRIDWMFENGVEIREEKVSDFKKNINSLYIACTRAKEVLHIITTEDSDDSIYVKLLHTTANSN